LTGRAQIENLTVPYDPDLMETGLLPLREKLTLDLHCLELWRFWPCVRSVPRGLEPLIQDTVESRCSLTLPI